MPNLPNAFALIVGIARYASVNSLPDTVLNDAAQMQAVLVDERLCGYLPSQVKVLSDGQATQAALRSALADLARCSNADSNVLIYISCHGGRIPTGPFAGEYLLPSDACVTSFESLAGTSISGAEFTRALQAIPARKLVTIFDCCHAGGIGQPKDSQVPTLDTLPESYYQQLAVGRGRVILASSRSDEISWIADGAPNSLFTRHLLAGLRGGAPGVSGVIRIFDLFDYVQPRVTAERPGQHPIFKAEIEENFPLALHLGGQKMAIPASPTLEDGFEYDAFISYSGERSDRQWLRDNLLPPLENFGLRLAVDFRAPLGLPKLLFSESAIQNSRYTIVLLTENYLASGAAEFENLAAQQLGIEQCRYRLLPIMSQACTPRLGLRMLPILDCSEPDERSENIDRLIYQLCQAPRERGAFEH